jgi:hypothetical protein
MTKRKGVNEMKTIKEMKKEIENKYEGVPDKQVYLGGFLKKVGRKYAHIVDTWEEVTIRKIPIEDFFDEFCRPQLDF